MRKNRKIRALFFILTDIVWISLAVFFAFILRFEGNLPLEFTNAFNQTIILSLIFYIPVFYVFNLYSFSWSYVSTKELVSLIIAATFSLFLVSLATYLSESYRFFLGFPRSVIFVSYFLIILLAGGFRIAKRVYLQSIKKTKTEEKVLIVGAGDAGEQVLRSIQSSKESHYSPVGFVDDNRVKQGIRIHGEKVLGRIEDIPNLVNKSMTAIIALPSVGGEAIKRAVELLRKGGIKKIKILPSFSAIVNEEVSLSNIQDFKVEDLLDREPLLYNQDLIKNFLENKTILVTGAAGSIGSELSRQVAKWNPEKLILLDQDETGIFNISEEIKDRFQDIFPIFSSITDIQDKRKVEKVFRKFKPDVVFHAAAYKHVPLMEQESEEAVKNNIFGSKNLIEATVENNVEKFVFISTDKAVDPSSVMGSTKRIGEMLCQSQSESTKFISVRFGNVLGSRGSVVPIFQEQIRKRRSIEVTHEEMKRFFMTIPEAVSLVLDASQMGQGKELFVLNMGNPVRILDLAKAVIKLSGLEPDKDIPIVFSDPRPGEKITEKLLTEKEQSLVTENKNIFVARSLPVEKQKLELVLNSLKQAITEDNKEKIKTLLREAVS